MSTDHRAPRLRGEWREDGLGPDGRPDLDYFHVYRVPRASPYAVRARLPLALLLAAIRKPIAHGREPERDEVAVNLGRYGRWLGPLVRVEIR